MKPRVFALLAALLAAASCSNAKTYEMRGQILGVNRDKMEILVKHEEIPGLMSAMTMPWKVQTANMLDNIGPGDLMIDITSRGGDTAKHEALVQQVAAASKRTGTPCGYVCPTRESAEQRIREGFTFINYASDNAALQSTLRTMKAETSAW